MSLSQNTKNPTSKITQNKNSTSKITQDFGYWGIGVLGGIGVFFLLFFVFFVGGRGVINQLIIKWLIKWFIKWLILHLLGTTCVYWAHIHLETGTPLTTSHTSCSHPSLTRWLCKGCVLQTGR